VSDSRLFIELIDVVELPSRLLTLDRAPDVVGLYLTIDVLRSSVDTALDVLVKADCWLFFFWCHSVAYITRGMSTPLLP